MSRRSPRGTRIVTRMRKMPMNGQYVLFRPFLELLNSEAWPLSLQLSNQFSKKEHQFFKNEKLGHGGIRTKKLFRHYFKKYVMEAAVAANKILFHC